MAGPVDTRKRSREEEQNEFMPLSKRINNLHLNNNQGSLGGVLAEQLGATANHHGQFAIGGQPADYANHATHHHMHHHHHHHLATGIMNGASAASNTSNASSNNGALALAANSGSNSPASTHASTISINGEILGEYCPVLSAEENPHYFTKNKVLYDLYVERMRRLQ
uniref:Putative transcription factor n=1 Tax=Anopheles marajoara TaxID=58244 RepID=A0A2M4C1N7_9DIPT